MDFAIIPILLTILIFLYIPIAGLITLQVYLSKMEKDWPGLILPILFGLASLYFTGWATLQLASQFVLAAIPWIIVVNIPSLVFYLIYRYVHKKQSPKKELDKMTIQDLS